VKVMLAGAASVGCRLSANSGLAKRVPRSLMSVMLAGAASDQMVLERRY